MPRCATTKESLHLLQKIEDYSIKSIINLSHLIIWRWLHLLRCEENDSTYHFFDFRKNLPELIKVGKTVSNQSLFVLRKSNGKFGFIFDGRSQGPSLHVEIRFALTALMTSFCIQCQNFLRCIAGSEKQVNTS